MTRLYNPTYDDIHDACWGLSKQILLYGIELEAIVGIARGGLVPATALSQMLDIPLIPISYSAKDGKGDNKNHLNQLPEIPYKRILLLDDICDSGKTLSELAKYYDKPGDRRVYTAAIYFKQQQSPPIVPNLFWVSINEHDENWIHFPWEVTK